MPNELVIEGINYISSKRASEITGYSQDYVGQLARAGKIIGKRVGGLWYVIAESVTQHKSEADAYIPTPPVNNSASTDSSDSSIVTFEGKTYVSAPRAAKLTSYNVDYIGQLARGGKILSKQLGRRWYVDLDALKQHKLEKDSLLGAVQSSAVGIAKPNSAEVLSARTETVAEKPLLHYSYTPEERPLIPAIESKQSGVPSSYEEQWDRRNIIPINVVKPISDFRTNSPKLASASTVPTAGKTIFIKLFYAFVILASVVFVFNLNVSRLPTNVTKIVTPDLSSLSTEIRWEELILLLQASLSKSINYTRD